MVKEWEWFTGGSKIQVSTKTKMFSMSDENRKYISTIEMYNFNLDL